jgi:hypothetical protein
VSETKESGGEVQVPKVGALPKRTLIGVGAAAAGYVGWRIWQAKKANAAAAATDTTGTDPGYQDPGTIPAVAGAGGTVSGIPYGDPSSVQTVGDYGFTGTTNAQWTQYAANQLVQSQSWDYTSIVSALGQYLNHRPLSTDQVQIVQAAIAVAGYPPVGSFSIVPGGDTGLTVAPSGLQVASVTATSATLTWLPVAGAHGYHVDGHSVTADVTGTQATLSGLKPGTAYSVTVAAEAGNGSLGPASDPVSVHTSAQPTTPPPSGGGGKPKPPAKGGTAKFPKRKSWHIKVPGESYASIAHRLAPGFTASELWQYQSNPGAGHSRGAAAKLHAQGEHEILNGQAIAIPYPK